MEGLVSGAESCVRAATRETSVAAAGLGAEEVGWTRRRPVVVGKEEASCQPADDTGRSADGEVMRRRVGTLGAELEVGAEARRRPVVGMAAGELAEEAGEAEDPEEAETVCPVGRAVLRRVGPSGAPGKRWLPEAGAAV